MNANELHIGKNLAINITHNKPNILYFSKINGSKNSSINFSNNSIIYQKENSNLKNIKIKSEEYDKEEKLQTKLNYIATTINTSKNNTDIKIVTSQLTCSKCGNNVQL